MENHVYRYILCKYSQYIICIYTHTWQISMTALRMLRISSGIFSFKPLQFQKCVRAFFFGGEKKTCIYIILHNLIDTVWYTKMTISIRPTGTLQYTNVAGWKKHSDV